jgi:hypothetical protein
MPDLPALLLGALQFQEGRPETLRALSDADWEAILSSWQVVRLTLPLRQRFGKYLPAWVSDRIDGYLADTAVRFERIKKAYALLSGALSQASVEHVVIKGFSLWPGYTEHPRCRPQSDIDLYSPPDSILGVRDALLGLGYLAGAGANPKFHMCHDHLPSMTRPNAWQWRGDFFDPDIPISFELHFRFWDSTLTHIDPPGLPEFWQRRAMRQLDGITFPALDPVDNVGYTALNLLRNLLIEPVALDQAYGLARFLHTYAQQSEFWQTWRIRHTDELRRMQALSFYLVSDWFDCSLAEEPREEINRLTKRIHTWFRHFSSSATSSRSKWNKDGIWLHLSLLESIPDKFSVLRRRLFPFPRPMWVVPFAFQDMPPIQCQPKKNLWPRFLGFARLSGKCAQWVLNRSARHLLSVPYVLWRGLRFRLCS